MQANFKTFYSKLFVVFRVVLIGYDCEEALPLRGNIAELMKRKGAGDVRRQ